MLENLFIIITYLLIGMTLRRIPTFPHETGHVLNLFVIYVSVPALVLLKIPDLLFSKQMLVLAITPWGTLLLSCAIILFLAKFLKWDRSTTGCLLLLTPLGNTSFLGIPMVEAFFGDQAIPYAVLYDQFGSFPALVIYGSLIIALYGAEDGKPTVLSVIKKIISFPPFIALILAFILKSFSYPALFVNLLKVLSSTLVPVVMIAVGFQLTLRLNKAIATQLSVGLIIKLVIAPLTVLFFCRAIGLEGEAVQVAVFEAGMPPMISAGALAILANLSPPLSAALVGIGIVLSFITLPILYQLL